MKMVSLNMHVHEVYKEITLSLPDTHKTKLRHLHNTHRESQWDAAELEQGDHLCITLVQHKHFNSLRSEQITCDKYEGASGVCYLWCAAGLCTLTETACFSVNKNSRWV